MQYSTHVHTWGTWFSSFNEMSSWTGEDLMGNFQLQENRRELQQSAIKDVNSANQPLSTRLNWSNRPIFVHPTAFWCPDETVFDDPPIVACSSTITALSTEAENLYNRAQEIFKIWSMYTYTYSYYCSSHQPWVGLFQCHHSNISWNSDRFHRCRTVS